MQTSILEIWAGGMPGVGHLVVGGSGIWLVVGGWQLKVGGCGTGW